MREFVLRFREDMHMRVFLLRYLVLYGEGLRAS